MNAKFSPRPKIVRTDHFDCSF